MQNHFCMDLIRSYKLTRIERRDIERTERVRFDPYQIELAQKVNAL